MICNNNYLADILRVCEIKDLIWVMRFQSPLVYISFESSATVEPRQRISNIYIYLYVHDQSVFIGSELILTTTDAVHVVYWFLLNGLHLLSSQH